MLLRRQIKGRNERWEAERTRGTEIIQDLIRTYLRIDGLDSGRHCDRWGLGGRLNSQHDGMDVKQSQACM